MSRALRRYKNINMIAAQFNNLALGTRFKHLNEDVVWVKIGNNLIARWDEDLKACSWIGQEVCCFDDTEDLINLLEKVLVL